METGLRRLESLQHSHGFLLERIQERPASTRVEAAHAAKMRRETAFGDEAREHALREAGRVSVGGCLERREDIDGSGGHDEVTEAETGRQNLAEGTEIEHAMAAIERVERRQRPAAVAVLAVVVVLEDPGVRAFGPIEQRQPAP